MPPEPEEPVAGDEPREGSSARLGERWLQLLLDVTLIANEAESLEDALTEALGRVCDNNGWHTGYGLVPGHPREFVWLEPDGSARRRLELPIRRLVRRWARQVMEEGQTRFVDDFASDREPALRLPDGDLEVGGAVATPLLAARRVVGAMVFLSRHALSERLGGHRLAAHVKVIDSIGTQMGRAAERWHLIRRIAIEAENEREAVGREIHDGLAQQLVGVGLLAQNLRRELSRLTPAEDEKWELLNDHLQSARRQAHALARGLSSSVIDAGGESLIEQLTSLTEVVEAGYEVECTLEAGGVPKIDDLLARTQLLRIAREAVFNALRHAQASRIRLLLDESEEDLTLEIRDDGRGLPADLDLSTGMGIAGMRYRAALIGARLELESSSAGTVVRCSLARDAAEAARRDGAVDSGVRTPSS